MITRFLKDTSFNVTAQVVGFMSSIISSIIIARTLGVENRGILTIILLLPTTIRALIASGSGATVIRSIASKQWSDSEIIPRLLGIYIYLSIAMMIVGGSSLSLYNHFFNSAPISLLIYSLILMLCQFFLNCFVSILSGKQSFKYKMYYSLIGSPISLLFIVIFVWYLDLDIFGVIIGYIFGSLVEFLALLFFICKLIGPKNLLFFPEMRLSVLRNDLLFGAKVHISNLSTFLNYRFDQFIIHAMIGSHGVGIYTISVNNTEKLWILSNNLSAILFPIVAEKAHHPDYLARFAARLTAIILMALTAGGIVALFFAEALVTALYGEEYRQSGVLITCLIPGIIALGAAKIMSNYIAGCGRPELNAIGSCLSLSVNIVANLCLIPIYHLKGAAIATSISYIVLAIFVFIAFVRMSQVSWLQPLIPSKRDLLSMLQFGGKLIIRT